jgi:glutaredoxin
MISFSFAKNSFGSLITIGLMLLLILGVIPRVAAEDIQKPPAISTLVAAADIEVFVRDGCPHCAKAEEFLHKLQQERPGLQIVYYNINQNPEYLQRLKQIAQKVHNPSLRVPAFYLNDQLIVGYSDEMSNGQLIRNALGATGLETPPVQEDFGSCEAEKPVSCETSENQAAADSKAESFQVNLLGHTISLEEVGLPLFTLAMGLLDGFNPCSIWVLILMISMLAPMQNRMRMLAVAGVFVAVEGVAYFVFMAAWLNLFLLIGLSRLSEMVIAVIAIVAGAINLKDFWAYGRGISLSIPQAAKPGIYNQIRKILQAESLLAAMIGATVLAILVQIVELLCTSGFPALYTRILTLRQLDSLSYYGYLLLYNLAYMFDDFIILGIGVVTLSQQRLQEKEGRRLKLISGLVMLGLGVYLLIMP